MNVECDERTSLAHGFVLFRFVLKPFLAIREYMSSPVGLPFLADIGWLGWGRGRTSNSAVGGVHARQSRDECCDARDSSGGQSIAFPTLSMRTVFLGPSQPSRKAASGTLQQLDWAWLPHAHPFQAKQGESRADIGGLIQTKAGADRPFGCSRFSFCPKTEPQLGGPNQHLDGPSKDFGKKSKSLPLPGVEPGLSDPQSDVLTVILQ